MFSRHASISNLPPSVRIRQVEYSSVDSLVSALRGQDAVVSTLGTLALDRQLLLIDAAVTAGVRRFLPSEFGSDTSNPKCAAQKALQAKAAAAAAADTGLSYTIICTGPFLDRGMLRGFMNVRAKSESLSDGGDIPFSVTTLQTIGQAVCAVLKHPVETENRVVRVHSAVTTQNKLLAMAQRVVGADGWTVKKISVADMLESSWADIDQGKRDLRAMLGFIVTTAWGEGFGGRFEQTDNELLGIPLMSDEEVQAVVSQVAAE